MDHIPKRRQGIDGLSHRPQPDHHAPTKAAEVKRPTNHPEVEKSTPEGFLFNEGVSHPSLPQGHAHPKRVHTPVLRKLFVYPITQRPDKRVVKLAVVRLIFDPRFWTLLCLPPLMLRLVRLSESSPASLVRGIGDVLVAKNYIWGALIIGGLYVLAALSVVMLAVSSQVMTAIKIRSIDHRVSHVHVLVRNAVSNLLRTAVNWLMNSALVVGVSLLVLVLVWWVVGSTIPWIVAGRSYLVALLILLWLVSLFTILVRRPLQKAMLATTQISTPAIQAKSLGLVLKNVPLTLAAAGFWALGLIVTTLAVSAVCWAGYTYLPITSGVLSRIVLWVSSGLLLALIWLAATIWHTMYWASFYHVVVLRSPKEDVSDFLVPSAPLKLRIWPALVAICLTVSVLVFYGLAVFALRTPVSRLGKELKRNIPSTMDGIVPGIGPS